MTRFHRMIFRNEPVECDEMQMTHLTFADPPPFGGFMLHGADNSPVQIDLYKSQKPPYNEQPFEVYRIGNEGVMVKA